MLTPETLAAWREDAARDECPGSANFRILALLDALAEAKAELDIQQCGAKAAYRIAAQAIRELGRVRALADEWSKQDWRGHDTAAPFVRALRNALDGA